MSFHFSELDYERFQNTPEGEAHFFKKQKREVDKEQWCSDVIFIMCFLSSE